MLQMLLATGVVTNKICHPWTGIWSLYKNLFPAGRPALPYPSVTKSYLSGYTKSRSLFLFPHRHLQSVCAVDASCQDSPARSTSLSSGSTLTTCNTDCNNFLPFGTTTFFTFDSATNLCNCFQTTKCFSLVYALEVVIVSSSSANGVSNTHLIQCGVWFVLNASYGRAFYDASRLVLSRFFRLQSRVGFLMARAEAGRHYTVQNITPSHPYGLGAQVLCI